MQKLEQEQQTVLPPLEPKDSSSEPLLSVAVPRPGAQDDDDLDDIFLKAVAEIETQSLPPQHQEVCWPLVVLTLLLLLSFGGGTVVSLLTYPTVTVEVVPISKSVTLTTPLALPTRPLAPVTLTRAETTPTTGKGHQDARQATGTLTFYNGLFTAQTIPAGTVFTGQDGIQIATDQSVTIPANIPPVDGQATIIAHALRNGPNGNIAAGDITTTIANGVLVKNGPFRGGLNARDFQAVAQADLDRLTSALQRTLSQQLPQAFQLRPGEVVQPTHCISTATPDHHAGEEAQTITIQATETCTGMAYNSEQMSQQATTLFTQQTSPGANYRLVGAVQIQLVSVTPLTVSCHGWWASTLSPDYEQFLAERIAGDSPLQAHRYLLATGMFTRATVPDKLPPDPAHIYFQVVIGL